MSATLQPPLSRQPYDFSNSQGWRDIYTFVSFPRLLRPCNRPISLFFIPTATWTVTAARCPESACQSGSDLFTSLRPRPTVSTSFSPYRSSPTILSLFISPSTASAPNNRIYSVFHSGPPIHAPFFLRRSVPVPQLVRYPFPPSPQPPVQPRPLIPRSAVPHPVLPVPLNPYNLPTSLSPSTYVRSE